VNDETLEEDIANDADLLDDGGSGRGPLMRDQNHAEEAQLEEFQSLEGNGEGAPDLEAILNIPVTVSMEIGRTKISIRNLLQLNQGSVVELDRLAGEPLDVLANGTLIAHGEVVVVNDRFGIRLTDVISAQERVKKLK
jgi:flagellar motor switch protein FliN/FliY